MKIPNIFMQYIYDGWMIKKRNIFKYLKHKYDIKKFRKTILCGSPSFKLLWDMADFIKYAEEIYLYDNSIDNTDIRLFSSRKYNRGENGLKLNDKDSIVVIKLYAETSSVMVEMERRNGTKMKSLLSFTDNKWNSKPTFVEELLLNNIIAFLNHQIIELFDRCYNEYKK